MKIKLSPAYLVAFFSLLFFINELRGWAHVFVAQLISGCWGTKNFDSWTLCSHAEAPGKLLALAWLAGPFVVYIILWTGRWLMDEKKSTANRSLGFSMVFAALPFAGILAAAKGRSDETTALRELFQNADGSNRHIISVAGLVLVLLFTVPPIVKAAKMPGSAKQKLLMFLIFLIIPVIVEYAVVSLGMNELLALGILQEESLPGTPMLVVIWSFVWLIVLMFYYKSLLKLFKKIHPRHKKRNDPVTME